MKLAVSEEKVDRDLAWHLLPTCPAPLTGHQFAIAEAEQRKSNIEHLSPSRDPAAEPGKGREPERS